MSAWTEARDRQMIADGWVKRPDGYWEQPKVKLGPNYAESLKPLWKEIVEIGEKASKAPKEPKPLLNKTETKACALLEARGHKVWKQAITLALDPPFRSYRADLAYMDCGTLNLIEAKAPHRFAKAGIAKAAVAAKTYPQFVFRLFMWTKNGFHESTLSP